MILPDDDDILLMCITSLLYIVVKSVGKLDHRNGHNNYANVKHVLIAVYHCH